MTFLLGSALRSQGLPVHHRCHGPAVARYAPRPTATCTATMQELSAWRSVRQNSSLAGGGTPAAGLPKVPKSSLVQLLINLLWRSATHRSATHGRPASLRRPFTVS
jgi:hypothetical protein